MKANLPEVIPWSRFSDFVGEAIGLHYPAERWLDLSRGTVAAAQAAGMELEEFVERLLSGAPAPAEIQTLARHLTIGETYFWRDGRALEALGAHILSGLIRERQGKDQRLRLWSAGCCSGEEAYSLAMLVNQILPDAQHWRITILGTDLNEAFLRKAEQGAYGNWSFRGTPPGFKERYFLPTPEGNWTVKPEIRKLVTFAPLNLMDLPRASAAALPAAMDVIFCRNVLMYFSPAQARRTVDNLHQALVPGGWLAVSPPEASPIGFDRFETQNFPGAIFYRKRNPGVPIRAQTSPAPLARLPAAVPPLPPRPAPPPHFVRKPDSVPLPPAQSEGTEEVYREARTLADRGQLTEALACCDRLLKLDPVDPAAHHLRATIALELGDLSSARSSLRRAVYLHPDFILAHVALGNLAARERGAREAGRHFETARRLLAQLPPEAMVAGAEGMTAGALTAGISSLREKSK